MADLVHAAFGSGSYVVQVVQDDTEPPTVPTGLVAKVKGKQVSLSWRAATDNLGVKGYTVWRNGAQIRDVTAARWVDKTVRPGVTYTYSVSAYDAAGNVSAASGPVAVTVKNGGGGGKGKPKK